MPLKQYLPSFDSPNLPRTCAKIHSMMFRSKPRTEDTTEEIPTTTAATTDMLATIARRDPGGTQPGPVTGHDLSGPAAHYYI